MPYQNPYDGTGMDQGNPYADPYYDDQAQYPLPTSSAGPAGSAPFGDYPNGPWVDDQNKVIHAQDGVNFPHSPGMNAVAGSAPIPQLDYKSAFQGATGGVTPNIYDPAGIDGIIAKLRAQGFDVSRGGRDGQGRMDSIVLNAAGNQPGGQKTVRVIDSRGNWIFDEDNNGSAWGGGEPQQAAAGGGGQQQPVSVPQVSAEGPYSSVLHDQIMALLAKGNAPVTADDPTIRSQFDPINNQLQRGTKNARGAVAERLAAQGLNNGGQGGELDAEVNKLQEQEGFQSGNLMSGFITSELQARRQDITNAMTFAQGEDKISLATQLANIDNQLRAQQIGNQNNQFYDQFGYNAAHDSAMQDYLYAQLSGR